MAALSPRPAATSNHFSDLRKGGMPGGTPKYKKRTPDPALSRDRAGRWKTLPTGVGKSAISGRTL